MAANVVDVFIHAIEHTGTENKHVSIPFAKVKAFFFFFFFLDQEKTI